MTGSAAPTGTFNLVAFRKIAALPVLASSVPAVIEPLLTGLPPIRSDACLGVIAYNPTGTGAAQFVLSGVLAEAT
jgi:hypothetical protein